MKKGDTVTSVLKDMGATPDECKAIAATLGPHGRDGGLKEGEKLRIFDCALLPAPKPGMPGRVLRVDDGGFDVRLNGGVLRVKRVLHGAGKKVGAGEWASAAGLNPGFRFR